MNWNTLAIALHAISIQVDAVYGGNAFILTNFELCPPKQRMDFFLLLLSLVLSLCSRIFIL